MTLKGERSKEQRAHHASASMHDFYGAVGDTAGFDEAFEPEPAPSFVSDSATSPVSSVAPASFARFQLLYESRDGKMAVFEDEHGHVVAVDTKRLA